MHQITLSWDILRSKPKVRRFMPVGSADRPEGVGEVGDEGVGILETDVQTHERSVRTAEIERETLEPTPAASVLEIVQS